MFACVRLCLRVCACVCVCALVLASVPFCLRVCVGVVGRETTRNSSTGKAQTSFASTVAALRVKGNSGSYILNNLSLIMY